MKASTDGKRVTECAPVFYKHADGSVLARTGWAHREGRAAEPVWRRVVKSDDGSSGFDGDEMIGYGFAAGYSRIQTEEAACVG